MRLIVATVVAALAVAVGCSRPSAPPPAVTGGDPDRGLAAIEDRGCAACHAVPGVRQAETSWVGPPLMKFARRSYIAGVLVNSEENLVQWITDPKGVDPDTAMPDLDVTELEARDIAAYLYTLR